LITIDDKLFITKEVNSIMVAYTKKVVFRKLLMTFCFESQSNNGTITDLFTSINFYGFSMPFEIELGLSKFLLSFKKNLEKEELTALYFWVLNQKHMSYLENFECDDDTYCEKEFDREFGRTLVYKIYAPNASDLEHDTLEELKLLLCNFSSEFDLSVLDKHTSQQMLEVIYMYCSSSNNPLSVA